MKRLRRRYRQFSLLKKTTLLTLVMLLAPCLLLSVFLFRFEARRQIDQEVSRNETVLRAMANDIRNRMTYVESVIALMAESPEIRALLSAPPEAYGDLVVSLLYDVGAVIEENTAYLRDVEASVMLVPLEERIPEIYGSVMRHESMLEDTDYARFFSGTQYALWGRMGYFMPLGKLNANFYNSRRIPYYKSVNAAFLKRLGTLKCSVSPARLFQGLTPWAERSAILVYQEDACVWSVGDQGFAHPRSVRQSVWREGQALYLPVNIGPANLALVLAMDYAALVRQAWTSILPVVFLVFQAIVLILVIARALLRSILGRLHTTAEAMRALEEGNTHIRLPEGDPDELGMLISAFNKLLARLNSQYEIILEKEVGRQRAQVLALQYQMNPHFLFNSLHWLQLQAEMGARGESFSNAIALLGNVLHYSLSAQPYATVGMEIAHIEGYVEFIRLWKRTDIRLSVQCGEAAKEDVIPRFTLQPLVENAVWHGLIPGQTLSIAVTIHSSDGFVSVSVSNDGRPVQEEQLADMRRRVSREGPQHAERGLGLSNLAQRLYLLYGQEASVAIDALSGKPRIVLRFPIREKEAMEPWIS